MFSADLLFLLEQWIALLLGISCLVVFAWTALDRYSAFYVWHLLHFNTTTLVSIGWLLTIAIGLIGVALMRFAFYKQGEPELDEKSSGERGEMTSGNSAENSTAAPIATTKRDR
ncbi:hypothetical protein RBB75_06200 [Tunturibacter empetritectus]|uniref:Uncharacterized protein n=1 Tax=Tunturiibacter empetritectus TaxID=3069691 RepID=A0AAU7ZHY1_9BACT